MEATAAGFRKEWTSPEKSLCEVTMAESRRDPGRELGILREDTYYSSLMPKVFHCRGLRAPRPSAGGDGAALGLGLSSKSLVPRLREDEGQPRSGLRGSGCLRGCSCPGGHFEVWGRELDPNRAPKRALRSAPRSTKLCDRPGPTVAALLPQRPAFQKV